jgi:hypothetical protein
MLRRGTRTWRFATPVVAAVQLAAVTFVPVAHPFLHDRQNAATMLVRPALVLPSIEHGVHVDVCLACLASPGMTVPQGVEPEGCLRTARAPMAGQSDREPLARVVNRANRERAPPLT